MAALTTKDIAAQNTFTDAVQIEGYFNVSISGTFSATVTAQRSYNKTDWHDVDSWTAPAEEYGFDPEYTWYRVGVKTGGYTSGTVTVRIGAEDKEEH